MIAFIERLRSVVDVHVQPPNEAAKRRPHRGTDGAEVDEGEPTRDYAPASSPAQQGIDVDIPTVSTRGPFLSGMNASTRGILAVAVAFVGQSAAASELSAPGPLLPSMDAIPDGAATAEVIKAAAALVSAAGPIIVAWLMKRRAPAKPRASKSRRATARSRKRKRG